MADSYLYGTIDELEDVGDSLPTILENFNGLDLQLGVVTDYIDIIKQIATWDVDTLSLDIAGNITANKVYNAVYNDIVDYQKLATNQKVVFGKCYTDTKNGAIISTEACQKGVIGIASDTYGYALGKTKDDIKVPIAVAGWVLAHVDKEYETGTPLTNDKNGNLTEMTIEQKRDYPERILAIYKKPETSDTWGPEKAKIQVHSRHWVKVK